MVNDIELNLSLREKYRILRKQKMINLKIIANEIGVSIPMLSMYENNKVNLSKEKEGKYCEIIMR